MPGPQRHRLGALHELVPEAVVDLVGHEHPLHRDAQLAGVGEARADGALGGPVEVGVTQHQDRVLAAELERAADQPVGALLRDQPAGGRRAGEADVVGALDHRPTEVAAGAGDHVPQTLGEAGLLQELGAEEGREHRLGIGLGDHRVAGQQRGQPVAQRHRERVVPGRDDADHALGDMVDLDPGQPGHGPQPALGVEVVVRRTGVVAGGQRDVQRLVERVLARLARLPADQVDDLVLAVEHQVVQAEQDLRAVLERRLRPRLLGPPCPREGLLDVRLARTAGSSPAAGP